MLALRPSPPIIHVSSQPCTVLRLQSIAFWASIKRITDILDRMTDTIDDSAQRDHERSTTRGDPRVTCRMSPVGDTTKRPGQTAGALLRVA